MGIFWKNRKKTEIKTNKSTKDLSLSDKQDILAMREDGIKPSDIADDLEIPVEKVSRVIELERAKQQRRGNYTPGTVADDSITQMNVEIKKLELDGKKQKLEWALEDRKMERDAQFEDPNDDDGEADPMQTMIMAFLTKMAGGSGSPLPNSLAAPNNQNNIIGTAPELQRGNPDPQMTQIEATQEEIDALIDQYPNQIKTLQKLPDSGIDKLIRSYFPQLTDSSVKMAIDTIKKKEIKVRN